MKQLCEIQLEIRHIYHIFYVPAFVRVYIYSCVYDLFSSNQL